MTRVFASIYIIFLSISFVQSECIKPSFENLTVQSDFNLTKFLGVWYEIQWLPGEPHSPSEIWRNYYQSFQLDDTNTQRLLVPGKARLLNDEHCFPFGPWAILANNSAKMMLEKKDPNATKLLNWPYYILKTDYDNYALIYGCTSQNDPCSKPILWVFGRTISLSEIHTKDLDAYIETKLCVNLTELEITPHDGPSCYSSSSNIHFINVILFVFLFTIFIT